ncbi:MAG: hypothetical protein EOP10_34060 [Proteobacteria bacterium]|nr:MAG: hypothetical protein EOP10_34060 [Pseudomonadota bacterium]
MSYVPDKGEIIELSLESQESGGEIKELALVMSPQAFNEALGLAWISPITFVKSRHLFQLDLPENVGTFGTVKLEQLYTVDFKSRQATLKDKVPAAFMERCRTAAGRVLGY